MAHATTAEPLSPSMSNADLVKVLREVLKRLDNLEADKAKSAERQANIEAQQATLQASKVDMRWGVTILAVIVAFLLGGFGGYAIFTHTLINGLDDKLTEVQVQGTETQKDVERVDEKLDRSLSNQDMMLQYFLRQQGQQ